MMQGSSQRKKPAVSKTTSRKVDVKHKLVEAKELEDEVKTAGFQNVQRQTLEQLTEIFNKIIEKFPSEAREHNCIARLFHTCFYPRVKIFRRAIMNDQKRQKQQAGSNSDGTTKIHQDFYHFLNECINTFEFFRKEYVERLGDTRTANMALSSSSNNNNKKKTKKNKNKKMKTSSGGTAQKKSGGSSLSSSDGSQLSSQSTGKDQEEQMLLHDVVANLHRVYMYLGDLQRYKDSNLEAEKMYLLARSIAPGCGQVYNQLGSVSTNKKKYMDALYFYARCMMVTHEPFTKVHVDKNMNLLENHNLNHMQEFERNQGTPIVLPDGLQKNDIADRKKGAGASCSRFFTKLMFEMLNVVKKETETHEEKGKPGNDSTTGPIQKPTPSFASVVTGKEDKDRTEEKLRAQMDAWLTAMRQAVKYPIFSDSILFKMVVIILFVGHEAAEHGVTMIRDLAREILISLGGIIFENTTKKSFLQKIEFGSPSKSPPFVKCLLVFEILTESVLILSPKKDHIDTSNSSNEKALEELEEKLWKEVVEIGNLTVELMKKHNIPEEHNDGEDNDDKKGKSTVMKIHEYRELKGCKLFYDANVGYEPSTEMIVGPYAAMEALKSEFDNALSQSQETKLTSSTGGGSAGPEEQKAKLHRMLEICRNLSSDSSVPIQACCDGSAAFVYGLKHTHDMASSQIDTSIGNVEEVAPGENTMDTETSSPNKPEVLINNDEEDNDDGPASIAFADDMDDEAGDAVVYKPQPGGGPALLTPAGILAGNSDDTNEMQVEQQPTHDTGKVDESSQSQPKEKDRMEENSKSNKENGRPLEDPPLADIRPPPGIEPPPGFGSAAATSHPTSLPAHGVTDPLTAPIIGKLVGVRNDYHPPNSQGYGQSPLYPDQYFLSQQPAPAPPGQPVATGIDLYVDDPSKVRTANPFVPRDYLNQMSTTLSYQNSVKQERENTGDDEGLLPTGLFTGLWADDFKPSKNPWAR
mmetsp:Transcript_7768/g.19323  ORF Transcript_7768/g.19323 Transcript_7768/m.19323 type:complete len:977 (+) Transcript_7768:251-3181(+)